MSDPSKVDARADIFALGAVGYFLLTGNSPFPGRTAIEVFTMERKGPPAPLARAAANPVPAALEETISRCLAFDREQRPESAEALDAMLEACAAASPWKLDQARAWWRQRGPAALETARGGARGMGSDPEPVLGREDLTRIRAGGSCHRMARNRKRGPRC